jgi:hypothetical protein
LLFVLEVIRRLNTAEGRTSEWKSQALRAYQRRALAADARIASTYLAGTNTNGAALTLMRKIGAEGVKSPSVHSRGATT